MTKVSDVRIVVKEIRMAAAKGDHEAAFAKETALYRQVLEAVAGGGGESWPCAAALAQEALKTQKFKFSRWTA